MALKRKRSSPAFSSPTSDISTSSTTSSPLSAYYNFSRPVEPLSEKQTWAGFARSDGDARLNSRTRKRHRDNRPESEQIYANTMARLYNAQRERPHAEPVHTQAIVSPQLKGTQKTSLHSFWAISQPPPDRCTPLALISNEDQRCEDCDGRLQEVDAMDLDEDGERSIRCHECRRMVCDTCAIHGDQRTCLSCASHTHV